VGFGEGREDTPARRFLRMLRRGVEHRGNIGIAESALGFGKRHFTRVIVRLDPVTLRTLALFRRLPFSVRWSPNRASLNHGSPSLLSARAASMSLASRRILMWRSVFRPAPIVGKLVTAMGSSRIELPNIAARLNAVSSRVGLW
jgi:hypothetical protein